VTHQYFLIIVCPQRCLCVLLGHSALVHELFQPCKLLGGDFCVAQKKRHPATAEAVFSLRWSVRCPYDEEESEVGL
jgi:hypothetical protein